MRVLWWFFHSTNNLGWYMVIVISKKVDENRRPPGWYVLFFIFVIGGEEDDHEHVCEILPYRKWETLFSFVFSPQVLIVITTRWGWDFLLLLMIDTLFCEQRRIRMLFLDIYSSWWEWMWWRIRPTSLILILTRVGWRTCRPRVCVTCNILAMAHGPCNAYFLREDPDVDTYSN